MILSFQYFPRFYLGGFRPDELSCMWFNKDILIWFLSNGRIKEEKSFSYSRSCYCLSYSKINHPSFGKTAFSKVDKLHYKVPRTYLVADSFQFCKEVFSNLLLNIEYHCFCVAIGVDFLVRLRSLIVWNKLQTQSACHMSSTPKQTQTCRDYKSCQMGLNTISIGNVWFGS